MSDSESVRVAAAVSALRSKYGALSPVAAVAPKGLAEILAALNEFQECIRYLNTRRSKGAILKLASEADVQDALYLMLRPWLRDLVHENPTDRTANRYVIKDLLVPSLRTVIEVKYVRDKAHGKSISSELHDDIEMYRRHPLCSYLVFFIYDPDSLIGDQRKLVDAIQEERTYSGKPLHCHVIVKP
jgi:hypothetical protein